MNVPLLMDWSTVNFVGVDLNITCWFTAVKLDIMWLDFDKLDIIL